MLRPDPSVSGSASVPLVPRYTYLVQRQSSPSRYIRVYSEHTVLLRKILPKPEPVHIESSAMTEMSSVFSGLSKVVGRFPHNRFVYTRLDEVDVVLAAQCLPCFLTMLFDECERNIYMSLVGVKASIWE
jgi:hypothetical protein